MSLTCLDPSLGRRRAQYRWPQLHASPGAADDTAKSKPGERRVAAAARGEPREWCHRPSVALLTVEAEGVVACEQVGDRVEADRGMHAASIMMRGKVTG